MLISFIFIGFISNTYAQEIDSTSVLLPEITGNYKGDIKDKLANGKGTAKGEDTYSGEFKNGLPDGKGKYTYKNGNTFTGYFKNGLKNGKGIFNYTINGTNYTQKGYWVSGNYSGPNNPDELYIATNISNIDSYTINKLNGEENNILISVLNGETKYIPVNLQIQTSSGQWQMRGKNIFINDYFYPINCEIYFTINAGGLLKQCYFTFEILKAGQYEVVIHTS